MSEQEKQFDPRIGKHGVYPALVCAGTGQHVNGRHNTAISLSDGYYCRVLNKWTGDRQALRQELHKVIADKAPSGKQSLRKVAAQSVTEEQSNDQQS